MLLTLLFSLGLGFIFAMLNEYTFHFMIDKTLFYFGFIVGGFIVWAIIKVISTRFKIPLVSRLVAIVVLALILMPYMAFMFGRSDMFLKDDAMPQGLTFKQVTVRIIKQEMRNSETGQWVTVMENRSMTLYPGRNWVWLGQMNLPAGNYDRIHMVNEIEPVIEWNQSEVVKHHPDWRVPDPAWDSHCKSVKQIAPNVYNVTFLEHEDRYENITISKPSLGGVISPNPDMGLDITLGEDGFPSKIAMHIFLPEPIGEIIEEQQLPARPKHPE